MMKNRTDEELEWIANNEAWDYDIRAKATEEIIIRQGVKENVKTAKLSTQDG